MKEIRTLKVNMVKNELWCAYLINENNKVEKKNGKS